MATVFQTRSETTGFKSFTTMKKALKHAKKDSSVWKIGFRVGKEYLGFYRSDCGCGDQWVYLRHLTE